MIEDKQVEAWMKEFWDIVEKSPDSIKNSEYNQIRLEGFLMAKRSMQPIELPKPYIDYDEDDNACKYWTKKQINDAITAAGYSYKVKE